jgi:hypothetical protein
VDQWAAWSSTEDARLVRLHNTHKGVLGKRKEKEKNIMEGKTSFTNHTSSMDIFWGPVLDESK